MFALPLPDLLDLEPVRDVLADAHVWEQGVVLKDGVDRAVERRDAGRVAAVELDPAEVGLLEARDQAQRRRLPRPRRPEQGEELTTGDLAVDAIDRDHVAVALTQTDQPNVDRFAQRPRLRGRKSSSTPVLAQTGAIVIDIPANNRVQIGQ